jgi:hypothetical protein
MQAFALRKRTFSGFISAGVLAILLAACGGGDGEEAASSSSSSPPPSAPPSSGGGNQAPTISGTPLTSVMQGSAYLFTPNASDADSSSLTFSIGNLPVWAAFSPTTGELTGTPSAAHVGTYSNITISVSDGSASASLAAFSIQVVGTATGSATLTWNPPTQNTDGSALTNLAGYKVYWGTSQGSYPNSVTLNNPGLSSYVVDQLTPANWYFALTAVNAAGVESAYSNVASKQIL